MMTFIALALLLSLSLQAGKERDKIIEDAKIKALEDYKATTK